MPRITMYTTPICHFCRMAKAFFQKHNILYAEKNVMEDVGARDEMIQKSGHLGVPVIDIDGEIIIGFDPEKLSKVLKMK